MGKYGNSEIHDRYSDWHWRMVSKDDKYKRLYTADIDRLWIEYDFNTNAVVAVIDIKWAGSGDGMTATEKGIYEWLEKVGAIVLIVYIDKEFKNFEVCNLRGKRHMCNETEFADFLLGLRSRSK